MMIKSMVTDGLEWATVASGNPTRVKLREEKSMTLDDVARAQNLGSCELGSGHDCFLKGISVRIDAYLSRGVLLQLSRYTFVDFVSVTSVTKNVAEILEDDYAMSEIDPFMTEWLRKALKEQPKAYVLKHIPDGVLMGVSFRVNYLQLKTIINQRKNHPSEEWRDFCYTLQTELPMFQQYTGCSI